VKRVQGLGQITWRIEPTKELRHRDVVFSGSGKKPTLSQIPRLSPRRTSRALGFDPNESLRVLVNLDFTTNFCWTICSLRIISSRHVPESASNFLGGAFFGVGWQGKATLRILVRPPEDRCRPSAHLFGISAALCQARMHSIAFSVLFEDTQTLQ